MFCRMRACGGRTYGRVLEGELNNEFGIAGLIVSGVGVGLVLFMCKVWEILLGAECSGLLCCSSVCYLGAGCSCALAGRGMGVCVEFLASRVVRRLLYRSYCVWRG